MINSTYLAQTEESYILQEGIYGAKFNKNGESLFLRMELITDANTKNWTQFKTMSCWVANQNSRGVLSSLVCMAGKASYPKYEDVEEVTGFTDEEYNKFTEKAIALKDKTENKIIRLLEGNSVGSNHMHTYFNPDQQKYIVYASKNPNFSIQNVEEVAGQDFSLKKFIDLYSDILISVGSNFSEKDSFQNRGISRNPYWVFEEKYSGLSMLLHGFTGAVAEKHFPEKTCMLVRPVGSMQCIIKKNLNPGEGYIERNGEKIDLTHLEVSETDCENSMNYITISALKRIYNLSNK